MTDAPDLQILFRTLTPAVLGALIRRYGDLPACEDAVQEALLAAALQWPADGMPANPKGWLITTASRRRIEAWRSDTARQRRERSVADGPGTGLDVSTHDDTLELLLLCAHPSLTPVSQLALTLRAVGGLTTAEIARALLVPESTVAQRISRAKQTIRSSGGSFGPLLEIDRQDRMPGVLQVLYLIFTEGHTASSGARLHRVDLTSEAIRLARQVHAARPADGEASGLLALMLLTDARRAGRTTPDGELIPLAEQDRSRWDAAAVAEGTALVTAALRHTVVGPYQLQAAIAAVHDEAESADRTDWLQILALYELLSAFGPGPAAELSRVVAFAMVRGPAAGLVELERSAASNPAVAGHHRYPSVRAHLLELTGAVPDAREAYLDAARRTLNRAEQQYLESKARTV